MSAPRSSVGLHDLVLQVADREHALGFRGQTAGGRPWMALGAAGVRHRPQHLGGMLDPFSAERWWAR